MIKLRCYVFRNLVREKNVRVLTTEELNYLDKHRTECDDCRALEQTNDFRLGVSSESELQEDSDETLPTRTILDNLGLNIRVQ